MMKDRLIHPLHYVFEDDQFMVTSDSPIFSGETRAQYSVLMKAYETDDYFFLYITPRQAYLIGKNDFTAGNSDELRQKLVESLGMKFYKRYGKRSPDR